jgi:6-pyruvoyltetrahydropterin/6-carboxytetrahydropterin synthase
MTYRSTKTYGHELGLSACFRQWRADSHCRLLHGYALSFKFVFVAEKLDDRNWVMDFGGLKGLKQALVNNFDHKLLVAADDPKIGEIVDLVGHGIAEVHVLEAVGCEAFAKLAYDLAVLQLKALGIHDRVRVISCECAEHGANSAIYSIE